MKHRVKYFFISLFWFIGELSCSQILYPEEKSEIQKIILKNGLTVVAKKIKNHPLVSLEFLVKTGSSREREYLGTGISHLLEHLIFKGTNKFPPGEIARCIKMLGGEINGHTTYDYTSFSITVPREHSEEALEIITDAVFNPLLREEDFVKERQVILNEMLMEKDSPQRMIFRIFFNNFYRIHPYKYPIIGYPELFSKLTLEDVKKFHHTNYIPNNIIIGIVGGFEEKLLEKLKAITSEIERERELEIVSIIEPPLISPLYYEEESPVELMHLIIGFPGVDTNHPDIYALDLLATILGEGKSSRLYNRLKIKKNLTYTLSCFNYTPKERGVFGIYVTGEYKNKDKIIKEIFDELNRIKRKSFSRKELEKAKSVLLHNFYLAQERVEEQAHQLVIGEFITGNPDFYSFYVRKIKEISPKDLKKIARKYLKEDKFVMVSLRPSGEIDKEIKKEEAYENNDQVTKITLNNGLVALVKKDNSLPISSINMVFLGGLRLENKDNNGISNLVANLSLKGTKKIKEEEINQLVEEKGGYLSSFSGNNSLGFSLNILSENTVWGIKFLSELIRTVNFTAKTLEAEKIQTIAKIREIKDNPIMYVIKIMKNKLFPNHPYGMDILGEIETIEKIGLEDISNFYKKVINPNNCVISVYGNFEEREVIKAIDKAFSNWKDGENQLSSEIDEGAPINGPIFYQEKINKAEAVLAIGFRTVSIYKPEYFSFKVLEEILGGQGNRLFETIREKMGLVYFVDIYNINGLDSGYFIFLATTEKKNLDKVKELILEEIRKLKVIEFTDEEIARAKAYIIGKQKRELQTKYNFSFISALNELYGLGFDYYKKYEENILAVNRIDLKNVVENYFKENNYIIVELLPED